MKVREVSAPRNRECVTPNALVVLPIANLPAREANAQNKDCQGDSRQGKRP